MFIHLLRLHYCCPFAFQSLARLLFCNLLALLLLCLYNPLHALLCVSITAAIRASLEGTIELNEVRLPCPHLKRPKSSGKSVTVSKRGKRGNMSNQAPLTPSISTFFFSWSDFFNALSLSVFVGSDPYVLNYLPLAHIVILVFPSSFSRFFLRRSYCQWTPLFPLLSGHLYLPPCSALSSHMSFLPRPPHLEHILYKACWLLARSCGG